MSKSIFTLLATFFTLTFLLTHIQSQTITIDSVILNPSTYSQVEQALQLVLSDSNATTTTDQINQSKLLVEAELEKTKQQMMLDYQSAVTTLENNLLSIALQSSCLGSCVQQCVTSTSVIDSKAQCLDLCQCNTQKIPQLQGAVSLVSITPVSPLTQPELTATPLSASSPTMTVPQPLPQAPQQSYDILYQQLLNDLKQNLTADIAKELLISQPLQIMNQPDIITPGVQSSQQSLSGYHIGDNVNIRVIENLNQVFIINPNQPYAISQVSFSNNSSSSVNASQNLSTTTIQQPQTIIQESFTTGPLSQSQQYVVSQKNLVSAQVQPSLQATPALNQTLKSQVELFIMNIQASKTQSQTIFTDYLTYMATQLNCSSQCVTDCANVLTLLDHKALCLDYCLCYKTILIEPSPIIPPQLLVAPQALYLEYLQSEGNSYQLMLFAFVLALMMIAMKGIKFGVQYNIKRKQEQQSEQLAGEYYILVND